METSADKNNLTSKSSISVLFYSTLLLFSSICPHFVQELLQLEDRLGSVSRGAVQTTIERFTFPHKYKKVGHNDDNDTQKHKLLDIFAFGFSDPAFCPLL